MSDHDEDDTSADTPSSKRMRAAMPTHPDPGQIAATAGAPRHLDMPETPPAVLGETPALRTSDLLARHLRSKMPEAQQIREREGEDAAVSVVEGFAIGFLCAQIDELRATVALQEKRLDAIQKRTVANTMALIGKASE